MAWQLESKIANKMTQHKANLASKVGSASMKNGFKIRAKEWAPNYCSIKSMTHMLSFEQGVGWIVTILFSGFSGHYFWPALWQKMQFSPDNLNPRLQTAWPNMRPTWPPKSCLQAWKTDWKLERKNGPQIIVQLNLWHTCCLLNKALVELWQDCSPFFGALSLTSFLTENENFTHKINKKLHF